jgi:chemotaxis protein CheX
VNGPSTAPKKIAPRTQWPEILRDTALEVFSTMVGGSIAFCADARLPVAGGLTGMIGIAGPLSATLSLRCSLQTATAMASHMLAVPPQDAATQKSDAVGEICNIVAGYFKAKIGHGEGCLLSVPTVVMGTNYKICSLREELQIKLPLLYESETALITLDIRP